MWFAESLQKTQKRPVKMEQAAMVRATLDLAKMEHDGTSEVKEK